VTAVGTPRATSRAKLGPESTETRVRCSGSTASRMPAIVRFVFCSIPLAVDTIRARSCSSGRTCSASPCIACDGHDRTTTWAPAIASARSAVGRRLAGKVTPGWQSGCSPASRSRPARAALRPQSDTGWPSRARWMASAVPQLPAPRTATLDAMGVTVPQALTQRQYGRRARVRRRTAALRVVGTGLRLFFGFWLGRPLDRGGLAALTLPLALGQSRDRREPLTLLEVDEPDSLGVAPDDPDLVGAQADHLAAAGHQHELVLVGHHAHPDDSPGLL